jgi:hypothetical protein
MSNISNAGPFTGKVRRAYWPITVDDALRAAHEAGYAPTGRGRTTRLHVQRDWHHAAVISQAPTGVMIRPAWTTAQMIIVAVIMILFLLILSV